MKRWLIALGIAALAAVLVWANLRQAREAAGSTVGVRVLKVEARELTDQVLAPATLAVARETEVRARVAGPALQLAVEVGDTVAAGQELAALEAEDLQAAVRQAEAALAQAHSQLAQLRRQQDLAPAQAEQRLAAAALQVEQAQAAVATLTASLESQQEAARSRLAQARVQLEAARARAAAGQVEPRDIEAALQAVQAARADLDAADPAAAPGLKEAGLRVQAAALGLEQVRLELQSAAVLPEQVDAAALAVANAEGALADARARLAQATIRAPVAGTLLAVPVRDGQPVSPGTLVAVLGQTDTLHALVRVDEVEVAKVAPDQAVRLSTPAYPGQTFPGRVVRVDPLGERPPAGTATVYKVTVATDSAGGRLRAGMNVDAEIDVATRPGALAVPAEALVEDGDQQFVWLAGPDGRATRRAVTTGLVTRTETEITGGLSPGDQVITGPLSTLKVLKEGQPVRPEGGGGP